MNQKDHHLYLLKSLALLGGQKHPDFLYNEKTLNNIFFVRFRIINNKF